MFYDISVYLRFGIELDFDKLQPLSSLFIIFYY